VGLVVSVIIVLVKFYSLALELAICLPASTSSQFFLHVVNMIQVVFVFGNVIVNLKKDYF
jgi:hypothetical protein